MLGKFCKKYFYTVTELTRTFGKGLCCKKEKKKDFCKVAISLQKERNNSGMAVEVMVVKCGKDPSWKKIITTNTISKFIKSNVVLNVKYNEFGHSPSELVKNLSIPSPSSHLLRMQTNHHLFTTRGSRIYKYYSLQRDEH